ncbi:MAG: hypothetical protein GF401_03505 [Chitinivibrionales bacterium]|nr:hypothetical protein [Chitinivibrionales bacterium]
MRRFHKLGAMLFLCVLCSLFAEEREQSREESKIRIGVLDLDITGGDAQFAQKVQDNVVVLLEEIGFYKIYTQQNIEDAFEQIKEKFPRRCRDPRCVREVGKSIGLERMLYGSLDKNEKTFGLKLALLDVESKQTIEAVSLESEPGVDVDDLLRVAVSKLHGYVDEELEIRVQKYFGPEINNEKEWLISSGVTLGAGLIWAIASGSLKGEGYEADFDDKLSGIPTGAIHIPMSARPAALANCYVALSDDAYGVLYNPAGIAWVSNPEAAVEYQYRFGMLNNIALSYVNKATREIGFGQGFLYSGDTDKLLNEITFISSMSYKFNRLLPFLRPVAAGTSVRVKTISSPENANATSSQKTFGVGLDLGLMAELSEKVRGGILFKDLLAFERVNNTLRGYNYIEYQPATMNVGGMFRAGYSTLLVSNNQIPLYKDQPWKMAGGIEQEFFRVVKLRLGAEKEIQANYDTPWKFTGGLGIRTNTEALFGKYLIVDASYELNTITVLYVINTSLRFGF